jgi:hypothetical protein
LAVETFVDADTHRAIPIIHSAFLVWRTRKLVANGTFYAFAVLDPFDFVLAATGLPLEFTKVDVGYVVAATHRRSAVAVALFVTDADRSTVGIHIAVSVRRTNHLLARTLCVALSLVQHCCALIGQTGRGREEAFVAVSLVIRSTGFA